MSELGAIIFWVVAGFWWGQWWAERRVKKAQDPALRVLTDMALSIKEKRKMVGPAMTIDVTQKFETMGEKYEFILKAEGDPAAFDREALQ